MSIESQGNKGVSAKEQSPTPVESLRARRSQLLAEYGRNKQDLLEELKRVNKEIDEDQKSFPDVILGLLIPYSFNLPLL